MLDITSLQEPLLVPHPPLALVFLIALCWLASQALGKETKPTVARGEVDTQSLYHFKTLPTWDGLGC